MQGVEVCTGLSSPRLSSDRLRSARPTLRLEVVASSTLISAKDGLDIGVHLKHIFEIWDVANGNAGLRAFLALDSVSGTTGIPRIIDKVLW